MQSQTLSMVWRSLSRCDRMHAGQAQRSSKTACWQGTRPKLEGIAYAMGHGQHGHSGCKGSKFWHCEGPCTMRRATSIEEAVYACVAAS